MQARLKGALLASLAVIALSVAAVVATYLVTPLASHAVLVSAPAAKSLLSQAPAAKSLWQPVMLKPDAAVPRGFSSREKRDIEDAVRTQIRAYVTRDAEEAFARLAPSTQRFFGKPDKFLRSIAQEVPTMLDVRRFAFLGVEQVGDRIVQQVLITDSTEYEWLAEFQLEQREGDDWRVKGCILQATPGQQAQMSSDASESLA
jgi:hypothetical protein